MKIQKFIPIIYLLIITLSGCEEFIEPSIEDKSVKLLAPVNGTETQDYAQNFWWSEVENALKYRLQVVTPDFSQTEKLVLDTLVTGNKFLFTLDPGNYEWRVRAENGSSETPYRSARFTIYNSSISQQQPQLQAPANNTLTNNSSTTFKWLKLFGADRYQLEIDTNNFADEKVLYFNQATANLEYPVVLNKDKLYQWRVRALKDSTSSKWSAIQTITFDGTPPAQSSLIQPSSGISTASPVTLKWKVISTAVKYQLYVYQSDQSTPYSNAFPLDLTATSYSFSGKTGEQVYWQVRAIDAAGNTGGLSPLWNFTIQ